MIEVTRMNGIVTTVNAEQIEYIEERPDTVINFVSGRKLIVKEDMQTIVDRVKAFFVSINVMAAAKLKIEEEN